MVRIAAAADIHCTKASQGVLQPIFARAAAAADVIALCGDLTDYGTPEEAQVLVKELAVANRIPVVAVLGNHDFESGKADEVRDILCQAGVQLLDGAAIEIEGVGFAGTKGFAGGFGRYSLGAWGELAIKGFVREALDEALKLEGALARLRTPSRVALLHYSPIAATVQGEPCEIFPFLGSSRLEEPLLRYPVTVVLHGHAHHGALEGRTTSGDVPVYNVALPLLRAMYPDGPGFRLVEVPRGATAPFREEAGTASAIQQAVA
ncbi:MAG: metallophosphoesterase [Chloroflexi bacterium]|nr:metallophosphoesterase [Chloroflexota bacterium]